jgi:hypothetical protein
MRKHLAVVLSTALFISSIPPQAAGSSATMARSQGSPVKLNPISPLELNLTRQAISLASLTQAQLDQVQNLHGLPGLQTLQIVTAALAMSTIEHHESDQATLEQLIIRTGNGQRLWHARTQAHGTLAQWRDGGHKELVRGLNYLVEGIEEAPESSLTDLTLLLDQFFFGKEVGEDSVSMGHGQQNPKPYQGRPKKVAELFKRITAPANLPSNSQGKEGAKQSNHLALYPRKNLKVVAIIPFLLMGNLFGLNLLIALTGAGLAPLFLGGLISANILISGELTGLLIADLYIAFKNKDLMEVKYNAFLSYFLAFLSLPIGILFHYAPGPWPALLFPAFFAQSLLPLLLGFIAAMGAVSIDYKYQISFYNQKIKESPGRAKRKLAKYFISVLIVLNWLLVLAGILYMTNADIVKLLLTLLDRGAFFLVYFPSLLFLYHRIYLFLCSLSLRKHLLSIIEIPWDQIKQTSTHLSRLRSLKDELEARKSLSAGSFVFLAQGLILHMAGSPMVFVLLVVFPSYLLLNYIAFSPLFSAISKLDTYIERAPLPKPLGPEPVPTGPKGEGPD